MQPTIAPRFGIFVLALCVIAPLGCSQKDKATQAENELQQVLEKIEVTKEPYKGSLTPEKAAEITHVVSVQSLAEFPSSKELPKDPKELMAMNERIRKSTEKTYAKYGTTMQEVMTYISDLSPKDRERYNKKLTDLFLEESRKKYSQNKATNAGIEAVPGSPAEAGGDVAVQPTEKPTAKPTAKPVIKPKAKPKKSAKKK